MAAHKNLKAPAASSSATAKAAEEIKTAPQTPVSFAWVSPPLLSAIRARVAERVPRGAEAGDERGKGVTPRQLLEDLAPAFGFETYKMVKPDDGGEEVEKLSLLGQEQEAMLGAYLRSGAVDPTLVARTRPFGGYGYTEDSDQWGAHPVTERGPSGPRRPKHLGWPAAWIADAGAAIRKVLPKPASWTLVKGSRVPVDESGRRVPEMATVVDITREMARQAQSNGSSVEEFMTLTGSSAEGQLIYGIEAGILGAISTKGKNVFWLSASAAAEVIKNKRDANLYDKATNPNGNKKAENLPNFAFVDPPTSAEVEKVRKTMEGNGFDSDNKDILTYEKYLELLSSTPDSTSAQGEETASSEEAVNEEPVVENAQIAPPRRAIATPTTRRKSAA